MPYKDPEKRKAFQKKYREEHKEELKEYYKSWYQDTIDDRKAYEEKYREEHKEELAAKKKIYQEEHKEEIAAKRKIYDEQHKEERKEYSKEYYEKNKDHIIARSKEYYEKNKETVLKTVAKYRETHKEEVAAKKKEWAENNKDYLKEWQKNYRKENAEVLKQKDHEKYENNKDEILERNKDYRREPAKYDTYYEKLKPYYGEDVRRDPENPNLIQVRCQNSSCREWFNPMNMQVASRLSVINGTSNGSAYMYCSDECKKSCSVYSKHKYPEGFKPKNDYDREVQPELREMVLERDNNTCQKCGKSKEEFPDIVLHCHHKFPLNEDPICSADVDNCITYCAECHKWVHVNVPGCSYSELRCSEKEDVA